MRPNSVLRFLTLFALTIAAVPSHAQVARVFVSVNGNDGNVCAGITTPCRTLNGAITQVDAQGEVIVIDSGSYAGANITKSVKINVAPGVIAFSAFQVVANPGTAGTVVLRGLTMKSATPGTGTGIAHISGSLFVENTVVDGWDIGVSTTGAAVGDERTYLKDTTIRNNNSVGVSADTGVVVSLDNVRIENNFIGYRANTATKTTATRSVFAGNSRGLTVNDLGTEVNLQHCQISGNFARGIFAGNNGIARISDSAITANNIGLEINGTGVVESYENNQLRGNLTAISGGSITNVGLQ